MGEPLYCSAAFAGEWGEGGYGDGSTHYVWLSSTALLPRLPGFLALAFPTMISSLTSSQFLSPQSTAALTARPLHHPQTPASSCWAFQGTSVPVRGTYVFSKDCLILIPFRLPQVSCFTFGLKCFSSDSDHCSDVGIGPLLQFPHPLRAGPVLLTLLFFPLVPSSYRVLRGSIYSFLLVRYSYPLSGHESACVLHALLCLKVYSWCICGKRCTPHPPTPLPSCSLPFALSVENSSSAILFYLTCSASMNLGETISYCGHTEVFLCESILMQAAHAQCLWWESWTWRVCQSHLSSECASRAYGWLWWSYVLAWRIPGTGEPGGLPSMESHRVGHDWSGLAAAELTWSVRWDFLSAQSSSLPCQEQDLLSDHWIRSFEGWAQGGSVPFKSVIFLLPALGPLPLQRGVLKQVGL